MIKILRRAIAKEKEKVAIYKGETNPQLIKMRLQAEGAAIALEAVLDYQTGRKFSLMLLTGNFS